MEPRIETLPETKLIGKRVKMSFTTNRTKELWQGFMPKRTEIINNIGSDLYSIEVYDDNEFFKNFNPNNEFDKWAAIQVSDFNSVPSEMETIKIPEGLYAVFLYKGKASEAPKTYQFIFGNWIPNSDYTLDDRPHFALMGEKYKNEDPNSEEELWIPIKNR
jgi:AraC family transcriptional regulator